MSRFAQLVALCAVAGGAMIAATGQSATPAQASAAQSFTDLRDFDTVVLRGPDNVVVTRGSGFSVHAEGDPKAIAMLDISVRDGTLIVSRKRQDRGNWHWNDKGATIRVTLPALRRATLAGSGDMSVDAMKGATVEAQILGSGDLRIGGIAAQDAKLSLTGSGDLTIGGVDAQAAEMGITGSGTLTIAGTVRSTSVSIAGSGDVLADRLAALTTTVRIAGSGNAHVRASQSADVSLAGSGDAMVRGTRNCTLSKHGSGEAHCAV